MVLGTAMGTAMTMIPVLCCLQQEKLRSPCQKVSILWTCCTQQIMTESSWSVLRLIQLHSIILREWQALGMIAV